MKYKITLLTILVISICLCAFGFWVDSDPRNPNVMTTVFEFVIMIILVFVILTGLNFATTFTFKKVKQWVS
jgi:hypothetical protein